MTEDTLVVVYPSLFAENKINQLIENIKKILNIKIINKFVLINNLIFFLKLVYFFNENNYLRDIKNYISIEN